MQSITAKKEARHEKKKKRLLALSELVKLNDTDQQKNPEDTHQKYASEESDSSNESDDDGESPKVAVKSTAQELDKAPDGTPNPKRLKVENGSSVQTADDKKETEVISTDEYTTLKRKLNERTRNRRDVPRFRLSLVGMNAILDVNASERTPILMTDVQQMLMQAILGRSAPCSPRWCCVEKYTKLSRTVVLLVEGLSMVTFLKHATLFPCMKRIFGANFLECMLPSNGDTQILDSLVDVPLMSAQKKELLLQYGSLEVAVEATKDTVPMNRTIFPLKDSSGECDGLALPPSDVFPRTKLLLSALQMVEEGYPLPLRGELATRYKHYTYTKNMYGVVTAHSPMFGLDCEMCRTTSGFNELTRVSIVNENCESVYDSFVRPNNKIVDYLTPYSGITPEIMLSVTKKLNEVQKEVRALLPDDAILVGQSLQVDLNAMRMMHPYIIDTSVIFNFTGSRNRKTKLQQLANDLLGSKIQMNPLGHDSIEDCAASLRLTKLKLTRGIEFGDIILTNRRRGNEVALRTGADESSRKCALVGTPADTRYDRLKVEPHQIEVHEMDTNKKAVRHACNILGTNEFTIVHVRLPDSKLAEDKIEKCMTSVDRWIEKIWDTLDASGLMMAMFDGQASTGSGIVMANIKEHKKLS